MKSRRSVVVTSDTSRLWERCFKKSVSWTTASEYVSNVRGDRFRDRRSIIHDLSEFSRFTDTSLAPRSRLRIAAL